MLLPSPLPVALALALAVTLGAGLIATPLRADDWPQHLGPRRDGTSAEPGPGPWSATGPEILWRRPVGAGFSAPVVAGGRLLVFHREGGHERLECLDPKNGNPLWVREHPTSYRDDFGFDEGPRSAPTVAEGYVYTFGAQGVLSAVNLESGDRLWSVDTHRKFGVRKGFFGAAASPLVHDGRVFLNVGGSDAGLVALSAETGEVIWQATEDEASYSSAVIGLLHGEERVVVFTREGLVVASPESGSISHTYRWRARSRSSVNAATPIVIDNRIFLSASYQTGAVLLEIANGEATPLWSNDESLSNHYATSVVAGGQLYGFHGRQEYGPSLRCVDLETGTVRWSVDRFGSGTITRVSDRLLVLHEDGRLLLVDVDPQAHRELASTELLSGVVRSYPAYADGVLYARDTAELVAARLRAASALVESRPTAEALSRSSSADPRSRDVRLPIPAAVRARGR